MKDNQDLKPCPFCGGNAKIVEEYVCMVDTTFYFIECCNCTATIFKGYGDKIKAIKVWNRRVNNG